MVAWEKQIPFMGNRCVSMLFCFVFVSWASPRIVKTSRELRDVSLERKSPRAERLQTGEGEG